MNIADFAEIDDLKKLIVYEQQLSRPLEEESWTIYGGGPAYYINLDDGEIVVVELDGVELTEKFSAADCAATADTFYYDDYVQRLYIHATDSDDPETLASGGDPKYSILAYFWMCLANRAKKFERRDQLLISPIFNFWASATDAEDWTENIAGTSTVTRSTVVHNDAIEVYSAKLTIDGGGSLARIYQDITTKPRRKHRIFIRYRSAGIATVRIQDTGGNVFLTTGGVWSTAGADCINIAGTSGTFITQELEFVTHPSYSAYRIIVRSVDPGAIVYVSRVELWRFRQPTYYRPLLSSGSIPTIRQSTGFYYRPQSQIQIGSVNIINDGWFWDKKNTYLWHNQEAILKLGKDDTDYEDLAIFFSSFSQKPMFGTSRIEIGMEDIRINLRAVPEAYFDAATYPNCEELWKNKPIPILFGTDIENITLPISDTVNHIYKVSQTVFNGTTYAINAVNAVYDDGVLQTAGVDYNTNLNAGTITLTGAPTGVITCDADGLCMDWEDGSLGYRPADFVYFLLVVLNGISKHSLNIAALKDLDTNRNLGLKEYIDTPVDSLSLLDKWQIAAVFQVIPQLDGKIAPLRYSSTIPDDTPLFRNEDFVVEPKETEDTDHVYKYVVIKYNQDPTTKEWTEIPYDTGWGINQDKVGWKYKGEQTLTVESNIRLTFQAENLWASYSGMVAIPVSLLDTAFPIRALLLNPGDKIKVSYTKIYDGDEKTIYDEEDFQIMSITKDVNSGLAQIVAFKHYGDLFWMIT